MACSEARRKDHRRLWPGNSRTGLGLKMIEDIGWRFRTIADSISFSVVSVGMGLIYRPPDHCLWAAFF